MKIRKPKWSWYYWYCNKYWSWKFNFSRYTLLWKDKYNTPRTEREPHLLISFGYWTFGFIQGDDKEWEQYLWIKKYNNNDYEEAKKTWPWRKGLTGESSWEDSYYK